MPFYYPGGRVAPSAPVSPKTMPATATGTTSARAPPPPLPTATPGAGSSSSSLFDSALAQYRSFPADVPPRTASSSLSMASSVTGGGGGGTPSLRSLASSAAALPPPLPPPPPAPLPFSHDDAERTRRAHALLADRAAAYREALGTVSAAASGLGAALETCARLKEARDQPYPPGPYGGGGRVSGGTSIRSGVSSSASSYSPGHNPNEASCTADVLLAASGFYFLQANQHGVLSETVYRSLEIPVVHELDRFGADVEAEQTAFAAGMRDASRAIRRLEKEGAALRRTRHRDLAAMRGHLVAMTAALDALTVRQAAHAAALQEQSRALSAAVSQAGRNLVRAELDILDSLARKGWPGGGLDVLLDGADDVFARDDDDDDAYPGGGPLVVAATAAAAAAGGTPTPPLGPKLLLLGQNSPAGAGRGDAAATATATAATTTAGTASTHGGPLDSYDLFLGGTDDEDDGSDVSTIDGHDTAAAAAAAPRKEPAAAAPPPRPRRKRVDSLSVDPGAYDDDDDDDDDDDGDDTNPDDTDGGGGGRRRGGAPRRRRPLHNALRYQSLDSVAAAAPDAKDDRKSAEGSADDDDDGDDDGKATPAADTDRAADYDPGDTDEGVHAWRA